MKTLKTAYSSKTGAPIVGTWDRLFATALGDVLMVDGELTVDYLGESDVEWNTQETVIDGELMMFVDSTGEVCREDEIDWREVEA